MSIYADINVNDPTRSPLVYDIEAVMQGVFNVLVIRKGEVLFEDIGSGLEDILFQSMDDFTEMEIKKESLDAIDAWETRARLLPAKSTITAIPEENKYDVSIIIRVLGLEEQPHEFVGELQR